MIEEYKKNGYVIFDDLLPEKEYKKKYLTFVKILRILRYHRKDVSDRYALWDKHLSDDKFFPDSDEVYQNQFWGTDDVVQTEEVKQMFDKYIKPKVLELTNNQAGKFMHQTNMYRNNGKDFLRIHYDDYMGLCGYVFYVGEYQWKYDWGGLLQMRVDDDVKTILPNKNRLVIDESLTSYGTLGYTNKYLGKRK